MGYSEPHAFEDVTVYFSDIVGFTKMSAQIPPRALIEELSAIFTRFDDIMTAHKARWNVQHKVDFTPAQMREVALAYKGLWRVERTFRKEKSTLEVRPIYHHRDDTSIGHIVASFLALRLEVDLQGRLDDKGISCSWPDLMRDLHKLQAVHITLDGTPYLVRTDFEGVAHSVLKAAGVRPPSRVTRL